MQRRGEDPALKVIHNPDNGNAGEVARGIATLLEGDFALTTIEIAQLLSCDRRWVETHLKPEVEHIFLNQYFRRYILEKNRDRIGERQQRNLDHSYYFYSVSDLQRWWQENAAATRQTKLVDICSFVRPGVPYYSLLFKRDQCLEMMESPSPTIKAKAKAVLDEKVKASLTEEGYRLYRSQFEKCSWIHVETPPIPALDGHQFITAAQWLALNGRNSAPLAYRYFREVGATRINVKGKSLWSISKPPGSWLIPASYALIEKPL